MTIDCVAVDTSSQALMTMDARIDWSTGKGASFGSELRAIPESITKKFSPGTCKEEEWNWLALMT